MTAPRDVITIFQLTLREALRRRVLLAVLVCGLGFLALYAIGFHFMAADLAHHGSGQSPVEHRMVLMFFVLAGLYSVNFLMVMTGVLLPVDTLSGEIESGVMQTVAAKPIRRSAIVLGKWAAYVVLVAGYLVLMAGGVLLIARVFGGITPPDIAIGLPLMMLEGALLVTLSIAGGARFSTVTSGVIVFGLYGLAFVGSWVEQIGTMVGNDAARNIGTISSLIMPSEALWHLAASHMQPAIMRDLHMTPFSLASVPSPAMVVWAAGYLLVVLALALRRFSKRSL